MAGLLDFALLDTYTLKLTAPGGGYIPHCSTKGEAASVTVRRRSLPELAKKESRLLKDAIKLKGRKVETDPAARERADELILLDCIVGWDGIPQFDSSEPLPFTKANVERLLNTPALSFIRAQILEAISDEDLFASDGEEVSAGK